MADKTDLLQQWQSRREAAERDRKRYERQWQVNQHFAAGLQWLKREKRNGRVFAMFNDPRGRPLQTADVLDQYLKTAIGKIAGDDLRPEVLALHDDALGEQYAADVDDAWAWGWDNEWQGERKALRLLRILGVFGTGAVRVRYDRTKGPLLAKEVPHGPDGQPILEQEQARSYVASQQMAGMSADLRDIREGKVVWEILSPWHLLPEPGIDDPENLNWEIIVRPVELSVIRALYPEAGDVQEEPVDALGSIDDFPRDASAPAAVGKLKNHALVYTGYLRPCPNYPDGQTSIFTKQRMLATEETMPWTDEPYGPRSGVTYFRWSIVPERFFGKGFIEPGIGPQIVRNKTLTQIDETIDNGQPFRVYEEGSFDPETLRNRTGEWLPLAQGKMPPTVVGQVPVGQWMQGYIELQDQNVEKALGLHDVSLGKSSSATAPYARIAYEGQNDVVKLGPIAREFKLGIAEVGRDTFEAMRQWPPDKRMMLHSQDAEGQLRELIFDATKLPTAYVVRPASGEALPRNQAAELQKIADVMQAAIQTGAVLRDPDGWVEWFHRSNEAGQPLDLPSSDFREKQRVEAEIENVLMERSGQPSIVRPYQDHGIHIDRHNDARTTLDELIAMGDQQAVMVWQVLDVHCQQHALMLQQAQMAAAAAMPPAPPAGRNGNGGGSRDLAGLLDQHGGSRT